MKRVLILKSDQDEFERYYNEHMATEAIDVENIYKYKNGILRIIMVIYIQVLKLPFQEIWYAPWKRKLKDYDVVIVFDRILSYEILKYIEKKSPKARLIFWYWNIVQTIVPDKYRGRFEIWSFDDNDCQKYHLFKNTQFYFCQAEKNACKIDVFFIGRDKGRYSVLKKLYDYLRKEGLHVEFFVVGEKREGELYITGNIPYEGVIEYIKKSRCIVEILQQGQSGLSIRTLEALFFDKKLITNNQEIVKEAFYDSHNIFILGKDDISKLKEFVKSPYSLINESIKSKYEYDQWINNFNL